MATSRMLITSIILEWILSMYVMVVSGGDPYLFFEWKVTYGTRTLLGSPEQVILINDEFPGPNLNTTTNNNIVVNVFNQLDEPLLFTWNGVQQRKNSWQDGTPGTMCPIPPGTNYTYQFQVKDQIGSYFYYPSINFHRASGAFGGLRINSRLLIPVPFADPEDDYTVLIGDWYMDDHKTLRQRLENGKSLAKPDGILINGKQGKVGDPKEEPMFVMKQGKTYRYRICNVGMKNSISFRFQNHQMKLVELEGSHTVQNIYDSLDVHLGQCYSVLVTSDQAPKDYYIVASSRFTKYNLQAVAIVRYEGGNGAPATVLPEAPTGLPYSLNQFRSFRWNLTASAARPNPQGSYHYGQINITRTIKLAASTSTANGKLRYAFNGVSHVDIETPFKLAEYYNAVDKVFKYDAMKDDPPSDIDTVDKPFVLSPNVLNTTYKDFIEIILENHDKSIQSFHLNGYSFFAVAIEFGTWTAEKRKNYNLLDAVNRYTIQVYPKSWAAIMLTFDNVGVWSLKNESPERSYLGQQMYFSVLPPSRTTRDERDLPENTLICGFCKTLPKPPPYTP